jgi:hypothetical protein
MRWLDSSPDAPPLGTAATKIAVVGFAAKKMIGGSMFAMRVAAALLAGGLALCLPGATLAAERTKEKQFAEPTPDKALVYLIREGRFVGGGRTTFVYSDDQFLGTLDNNSYTFVHVPPGKHLFWLNWATVNTEVELEAGKTYYYAIWNKFDALDEVSGKAYLDGVKFYGTATPREIEKSAEHIRKRYGKATASAAKKAADPRKESSASNLKRRAAHIARWPKADLTPFSALCVEPFVMADPNAAKRRPQYLVESAPQRLFSLVREELGTTTLPEVREATTCTASPGTVVLRARITQFQPGNETARFLLAGLGSAQIEVVVTLTDAQSDKPVSEFEPKGTWAWGGVLGASVGVSDLEKNVAYEIANYLKKMRGLELPGGEG